MADKDQEYVCPDCGAREDENFDCCATHERTEEYIHNYEVKIIGIDDDIHWIRYAGNKGRQEPESIVSSDVSGEFRFSSRKSLIWSM